MDKRNAVEVLKSMIGILKGYVDDLADYHDVPNQQFQYGEKVAYIECLEMIQEWELAEENGLDFDIEKKYPI